MSQPDVSIVIVNWNTKKLVCDCVQSILENADDINYEIIVIDNGSADDSVQAVKSRFPEVGVIANSANRGYAAACNQGMLASSGRYVLLLNSDILIVDNAIGKVVRYADTHAQAGLVGCQIRNDDGSVLKTCFHFPNILNLIFWAFGLSRIFKNNRLFGRDRMFWWERNSEQEVEVITGMFIFARREAIDKVGMMDEDYFFYGEEVDWCWRFQGGGWKVIFWPGAKIIHVGGGAQSSRKVPVRAFVQEQKSLLIFFKKHRGWLSYLAARCILIFLFSSRYFAWSLISLLTKKTAGEKGFYRLEKQKALAAFEYCFFAIEQEKSETKIRTVIWKKIVGVIEFASAIINSLIFSVLHNRPRRVVLYYHNLKKQQIPGFEKQMKYLADRYRVVKPSEIKTASANGNKVIVAITFDDACTGVFENAVPVLKRYKLPAAVSVPTAYISGRPEWLGWKVVFNTDESIMSAQQLAEIYKSGFEIFSHTVTHSRLTELDDNKLFIELSHSMSELEKITGHGVAGICYPHGDNNEKVRKTALQTGYRYGFTIEPELIDNSSDDLQLGRFSVSPDESLIKFRLKASGAYSVVKYLRAAKRSVIGKS